MSAVCIWKKNRTHENRGARFTWYLTQYLKLRRYCYLPHVIIARTHKCILRASSVDITWRFHTKQRQGGESTNIECCVACMVASLCLLHSQFSKVRGCHEFVIVLPYMKVEASSRLIAQCHVICNSIKLSKCKVAKYRHMYRAEPKEPTQYGSVSGSEIKNLPFSHSGIVSLYQSEPKEPT